MIDDDRGQLTGFPVPVVAVVAFVVLVVLVAEFGPSILALIAIALLVISFVRVTTVIGPASK